jgi:hypothetical protein
MRNKLIKKILIGVGSLSLALVGVFTISFVKDKLNTINHVLITNNISNGIKLSTTTKTTNDVTTYTINASIGEGHVINKKLNWDIVWNGSNSDAVSNYLDASISSDTHSIELTYKKQFNTQIKVIASAVTNPNVKAECLIDCYNRVSGVSILTTLDGYAVDSEYASLDVSNYTSYESIFDNNLAFGNTEINCHTKGTIDTTTTHTVKIKLSAELVNAFKDVRTIKGQEYDINTPFVEILYEEFNCEVLEDSYIMSELMLTTSWFDIVVDYTTTYGDKVVDEGGTIIAVYGFIISREDLVIKKINFDKSNLIF